MPRQWTENQQRAICIRDRDVCVSAGAGSGKTGVLVARFVRIIQESQEEETPQEQRADVGEILVITFTEKATKEMKERIVRALTEAGLTEQRRAVETAYISTIHGFCSRLLKENPFEAGVDPEFSVLEENEALRRLRNAVEDAVEQAFEEEDADVIDLVAAAQDERLFGTDITDPLAALADSVRAVLGKVRGAGWRLQKLQHRLQDPARETPSVRASAILRDVRSELIALRHDLQAAGAGVTGALAALKQDLAGRVQALELADLDGSWSTAAAFSAGLSEFSTTAQRGLRRRANPTPAEADLQTIIARMKAAADGAAGLFAIEAEQEEHAERVAGQFWKLLIRSWERYDVLKRTDGSLDNDDLQAEAVHLLRSTPSVCERYRRRFRYLLVDEFQDTNPIQMRLIDLLHKGARNNLFLVGDVQQSIYSFRNADPTIFQSVERRFRSEGAGEHVSLDENFRSRPEILGFINGVFGQIWSGADPPFMALHPGSRFDSTDDPAVELLLARDAGRARYVAFEAEAISRRIREMVGSVRLTAQESERRGETVRYRDVAVLLRALTDVEKYERAFHEAGVPYYVVGGGRGYYARFEVRDILNVLTVLETPLVDVAVAAALRSPIVGVGADTLYRLARFAAREDQRRRSLYGTLHAFSMEGDAEEEERSRIYTFLETIEQVRRRESRMSVARILETIIAETDLDARLLVRPNGKRRLANVRKLLQMAYADPSQTVGEFIRRLRDIEKLSDREGDAPTEEEASEVVRIVSIHKAKGLEFPVVFLGDMARPLPGGERGLFACEGRTLRLGCKIGDYRDSSYRAISESRQRGDMDESFRVLYVALTRARERLVLCGSTPQGRQRKQNWADVVFQTAGVLGPPEEPEIRMGPGGVPMRVARM